MELESEGPCPGSGVPFPPSPPNTLRSVPPLPWQSVDDDASAHDRVLWALHLSGMDDLLQFLASATSEAQWALHVLEVIALMLRDQVSWGASMGWVAAGRE